MDDYLRTLPGVNMQDRGAGQNSIVVRGIGSDPQLEDGNVGVYFGETPIAGLGTPSNTGGSGNADIKLVDIERIEILRGPQGTLYGSGSMGGTVRIIPNSPNLEKLEGKLATRFSQTGEDGGSNTMIQAVVNVPLIEEKLAFRGVAYRFDTSGYIENVAGSQPTSGITNAVSLGGVARDRDDIGNDEYTGFRATALWQATEALDVSLSHSQQKIEQDGTPEVNLDLSDDYQQIRLNTGVAGSSEESLANEINITNLVINYDFGWGNITSSSSWLDYEASLHADLSHHPGFGNTPIYAGNDLDWSIFVEEARFTSQFEGSVQFLLGVYYEDKTRNFSGPWRWSGDPSLDTGPALHFVAENTLDQLAFFGELSYDLTERLKATLGVRHFDYDKQELSTFTFNGNIVFEDQFIDSEETGQTYKANLSYTLGDDTLLYGQWTEGFRLGRGLLQNPQCVALGIFSPDQLDSDTSENFELGMKTTLLDGGVSVNAAIYRINWEGMPVSVPLPQCNSAAFFNVGESKSEGAELEIQARLVDNLQINMTASYGEATFTEDSPLGNSGDNLPGSADFNISIGVEYDFNVKQYEGFARIDYSYLSEYYNSIAEVGQSAGNYGQINLKTGLKLEHASVDIFVNNLSNSNGLTWVESTSAGFFGTNRAYRIRPRTIGLNIAYHF